MPGAGRVRRLARGLAPLALILCVAAAPPAPLRLVPRPDIAPDVEALPRIVAPGSPDQAKRINARLDLADARARTARAACLDFDPTHGFWERGVTAPFYGPRFVSLWIADFTGCGGAHPNTDQQALTYDLSTGAPINWERYLPARLVTPTGRTNAGDGAVIGTVQSPELIAWFNRTALAGMDVARREECGDLYGGEGVGSDGSLMLWLDAKAGGLAMQLASVPHVIAACSEPVVMPVDELRRQGAAPALIEAIEQARRAHGWDDGRPRRLPTK